MIGPVGISATTPEIVFLMPLAIVENVLAGLVINALVESVLKRLPPLLSRGVAWIVQP